MKFEQDTKPVFLVIEFRDEDNFMMVHGVYVVEQLALAAAMRLQNEIDCGVSVQNSWLYGSIYSFT